MIDEKTDEDASYKITSSANTTGESKTISGTSFSKYTWSNVAGDDETSSTYVQIECTNTKRIYVQKIMFLTEISHNVTFNYSNINDLDDLTEKVDDRAYANEPAITTGYSFADYEGTHTIEGWYTNLHDESMKFDFVSTKINDDITLYAKWVLSNETENSKNIKTSETKAQLNYTYKEGVDVATTATITFGETMDTGTGTFSINSFTSDGITIKTVTPKYCYWPGKGKALRVGSSSAGSFTLTFNEELVVKSVNVYATVFGSDNPTEYTLSSTANATGSKQKIDGSTFTKYEFDNLDNGEGKASSSITFANKSSTSKARIYISKMEFIIATGETVSSDTPIYNISNIGLRFGGTVKKSYYEALESHIKSFGMTYTTNLNGYDSLEKGLAAGEKYTEKEQEVTETTKPIEQTIDGEQYYVWNVYINVSSSSLDKVIYAAGKLTLDNGTSFYLKERSTSVKDIALEYYCDDTAEYSDEVKATLELLAEGKTKTDTTSSTDTSSSSSEEGE